MYRLFVRKKNTFVSCKPSFSEVFTYFNSVLQLSRHSLIGASKYFQVEPNYTVFSFSKTLFLKNGSSQNFKYKCFNRFMDNMDNT